MNIVIRADASPEIGTGHIMRCLTLAGGLKSRGFNIHFVCKSLSQKLEELILNKGFYVYRLNKSAFDPEETISILDKTTPEWLIVDHYQLDACWERAVYSHCKNLMVIDDLANRKHLCNLLLDQDVQLSKGRYEKLVPEDCVQLLGTEYSLLRPEFGALRKESLKRNRENLENIMILMGGADAENVTDKMLEGVVGSQYQGNVNVVIGPSNQNGPLLKKKFKRSQNITFHENVSNMAELMCHTDLCIGASGSACWERCCLGVPTIIVTIADNQVLMAEALAQKGAAVNLKDYKNISVAQISKEIDYLVSHPYQLNQMSQAAAMLVTGSGVEKVIYAMDTVSNKQSC